MTALLRPAWLRLLRLLPSAGALLLGRAALQQPAATVAAGEFALRPVVGWVFAWVVPVVAHLSAPQALTGATSLFYNPGNPASGAVGTSFSLGISVSGGLVPGSFQLTGTLPPGLIINNNPSRTIPPGQNGLIVNQGFISLSGTPTTPGNYTLFVRAYRGTNATSDVWPEDQPEALPITISAGTFLTLTTTVDGGGTVTRNPNKTQYSNGEQVTLTAVPATGNVFRGWGDGASGLTNPLAVTLTASTAISARFATGYQAYAEDNALPSDRALPQQDANGDGVSNALAMALGLAPTANARAVLPKPAIVAGEFVWRIPGGARAVTGVALLIEQAATAAGPYSAATAALEADGNDLVIRVPVTAAGPFFRLGANTP